MPKAAFTIPSGIGAQYFIVHLSKDPKRLRAAMRRHRWLPVRRTTCACCWECTSAQNPDLVGVVWLPLDRMGGGLVAHELAHAAFRALERAGLTVTHSPKRPRRGAVDSEEQFADVLERLTREFWSAYYDHGHGVEPHATRT